MEALDNLKIKIFCDAADLDSIRQMRRNPLVQGFTTNPTLMRKAGVADYEAFVIQALEEVRGLPVSFEVFADNAETMETQARWLASFGPNVHVKIPITNTQGHSTSGLVTRLSRDGIIVNVTALLTLKQVETTVEALDPKTPAIISVFGGRIADTGIDPVPVMRQALRLLEKRPHAQLLWASPRELLNVFQANEIGTHIITATPDILAKLRLVGRDLTEYSLETVKMFYSDALAAGYSLGALAMSGTR